jgi:glycosyltransferase involved in cell wall biosynthesis
MATISLSMIVKNEEAMLERALKSAAGVDEIIIVDTGSTDNTIEIARKYTDKVYTDYTWNDDFSEARNHAASKCTMDYILILDADEYLEDGAVDRLREFDGDALNVRTISVLGQEHQSIRLHRNTPDIYWQGAVHNALNVAPSHASNIKVYFDYSPSHNLDPDRSMRILKKELEKDPTLTREKYYLGIEYVSRKMWPEVIEMFEKYVQESRHPAEMTDAYIWLGRAYMQFNRLADALNAALQAIYYTPDNSEAFELMADLHDNQVKRMVWRKHAMACTDIHSLFARPSKRIRVTMLSVEDFAGSGHKTVKLIREHAGHLIDIEDIVLNYSAFGIKSGALIYEVGVKTVQDRINNSDIIHFKGDFVHDKMFGPLTLPENVKRIYTVSGSFFRRGGHPSCSFGKEPLENYKADYLSSLTPDMIYADNWHWTPHPAERKDITFTKAERFRVLHIPSDPAKKGSDMIDAAMKIVCARMPEVDYIRKTGITKKEVTELKKNSHLYIDQMLLPIYANAAIEAMEFGVPVVSWMDGLYENCPIISPCRQTVEDLAAVIIAHLNWDVLQEKSIEVHEYVNRVHGTVGEQWTKVYQSLINKKT